MEVQIRTQGKNVSNTLPDQILQVANWHYDSFNRRARLIEVADYVSPQVQWTSNMPDANFQGLDGYLRFGDMWATAFPDSKMNVLEQQVSGNVVTCQVQGTGTHLGVLASSEGEISPTGRTIESLYREIIEVRGGKIVRGYVKLNVTEFFQQLGLI